jgi:hypothetical protein
MIHHRPDVAHAATALMGGTRESLSVLDTSNGLSDSDVLTVTSEEMSASVDPGLDFQQTAGMTQIDVRKVLDAIQPPGVFLLVFCFTFIVSELLFLVVISTLLDYVYLGGGWYTITILY